jgi:hypothetical protein
MDSPTEQPEDLRAALEELLLHSGSSIAQPEHVDHILRLCEAAALAALPEKISPELAALKRGWIDEEHLAYNEAIATAQANIHSVFGGKRV